MDDIEKLRHQLEHWLEHNDSHIRTYGEWAGRAQAMHRPELAAILEEIGAESGKLNALFIRAIEIAGPHERGTNEHGHHGHTHSHGD